jgi:tetratricopeptide (TPR) repeat protein
MSIYAIRLWRQKGKKASTDKQREVAIGEPLQFLAKRYGCGVMLFAGLLLPSEAVQPVDGLVPQPLQIAPLEKAELPGGSPCSIFKLDDDSLAFVACSEINHALGLGKSEEARRRAIELKERYPKNAVGNFWLGQVESKQGNSISAVRAFEAAVDLSPDLDLLHLDLGLCYLTILQYKLFQQEMEWVIRHNPHIPLPYYYLGLHYLNNLSQTEKASEYFGQALLLNPNDFRSQYYLGYICELKSQPDNAKVQYQLASATAVLQKAVFSWPLEGLARLLLLEENLPEAIRFAEEAASVEPKLARNRLTLGKLYLQAGETSKGIDELKIAATLDPTDSTPHYWLSRAYAKLKMQAEAEREQKLFLEIKSSYRSE